MLSQHSEQGKAVVETVAGCCLFLTPWWAGLLSDVSLVAAAIASVAGAIIGLYGAWNLVKGLWRGKEVF